MECRKETNLTKFNCSFFNSPIGKIFYVWLIEDNINNSSDNENLKVVFLSNSQETFFKYKEKLKTEYPGSVFLDKKSKKIETELSDYLNCRKKEINLGYLFLTGSAFEKKIWETSAAIPYSQVASYKEIAERSGNPGAWRAAGTALGNNPLMLIIPCHRVIKSSGDIGFFGGGEKVKEYLLNLESADFFLK